MISNMLSISGEYFVLELKTKMLTPDSQIVAKND